MTPFEILMAVLAAYAIGFLIGVSLGGRLGQFEEKDKP